MTCLFYRSGEHTRIKARSADQKKHNKTLTHVFHNPHVSCVWCAASRWLKSCRANPPEGGADTNTPPPASWCCEPQAGAAAVGRTCRSVWDDAVACAPSELCWSSLESAPPACGPAQTSHLQPIKAHSCATVLRQKMYRTLTDFLKISPGLKSTKYLRQTNSCLSNWSAFSLDTRSWVLETRPLSVAPAWVRMVDTSICSTMTQSSDHNKSLCKTCIFPSLWYIYVTFRLYLLSWDQINAALFAVGHLSTEVIQDKQLAPAALQQHHLVLHLLDTRVSGVFRIQWRPS